MIRFLRSAKRSELEGVALLRLDFNTTDEWRLAATVPTVEFLAKRAQAVVIVSHRGRPDGKRDATLSLRKDAALLEKYIKRRVTFIPHFHWLAIREKLRIAPRHSVFLLENIRFLRGESTRKPELARTLSSLADFYVNDAFAVAHHPSDSVAGMKRFLPSYAGLELEKEIKFLSDVCKKPKKPLVLVLGGAKAHDKLGVIEQFRRKATAILVGGGSANTLLYLKGIPVGSSAVDKKDLAKLKKVLKYPNVILPVDWRGEGGRILDIGPRTAKEFARHIAGARTIIWSGPMGLIEKKKFAEGNFVVARAIARNKGAFSLTGGGETVMFLKKHKLDRNFSFISTGGGAFLEFLAGEKLPGIEALRR